MRSTSAIPKDAQPEKLSSSRLAALAPSRGHSKERGERSMELCECMIDIAAALFNIPSKELRQQGRTSLEVSRVRQIAMYVSHVSFSLSMSEVARGFGRERTTVLHACHLIEDMRDDVDFDRIVAMTERVAGAALRQRSGA